MGHKNAFRQKLSLKGKNVRIHKRTLEANKTQLDFPGKVTNGRLFSSNFEHPSHDFLCGMGRKPMNYLKTISNELDGKGQARPTMDDVAELAKVCKATVSMVMSNDSRITEETRLRVLETVKNLNYQVNQTARALALRRKRKPKSSLMAPQPVTALKKIESFAVIGERKDA
jgi:hypothetical protein